MLCLENGVFREQRLPFGLEIVLHALSVARRSSSCERRLLRI